MKDVKPKVVFICILIVAFFARFVGLGSFPHMLTWDEAAIGYNAYGIATIHRDEWLVKMPVAFRSFGDYKSPLGIYLTAASVKLFGLTPFAVRLPVALFGFWLVVVSYFFALEILRQTNISEKMHQKLALFVMLSVAISPWAIHFSRIAFESTIAAALVASGAYCWLRARRSPRFWALGSLCFALSIYAYHSAKVVVPLLALVLIFKARKSLRTAWKWIMLAVIVGLVSLAPFIKESLYGNANTRALSSTVLSLPNTSVFGKIGVFVDHFRVQLSPAYNLFGAEQTYRHSTKVMGVLTLVEFGFAITGMIFMIRRKELRSFWFIPVVFLISIVPAALGVDVPHANRALLGVPWIQILAMIGMFGSWSVISKQKRSLFLGGIAMVMVASTLMYARTYLQVYTSTIALRDMQYGYEEAVQYARAQERNVNRVYFTNAYGQAYIYLLFFKHMNPIDFRGGGLANYVIADKVWSMAQADKNVLVVGTPEDIPASAEHIVHEVKYPDGTVAFRIVKL